MKNIKLILFIFFCLHFLSKSNSQSTIRYYGEVRDTIGAPVQFANVMAVDTATNKMAGFAVTNANGQFKISLESKKVYQLKITFMGFTPYESLITAEEIDNTPILFVMEPSVTQLGEVEVVAEMPVTVNGDTITYLAEAFTQGNERKLEDVLDDLPGFEIEENGEIKVQGKKVDKVLVDGKEFFDGDSKMATKNIPANVVDKVQLLQDYSTVSPLRGLSNEESLAINVELKEDKKNMVFGDLTLGGGPQGRYLGHANTFFYNKKTNLNLITDANNIGDPAFTMSDYFRFAGGLGSVMNSSGSSFNVSTDQMGIPLAERNSAESLNNQMGAFNFNIQPSRKWRFSGFAIGALVDNGFGSKANRTYLQENDNLDESFQSASSLESISGLGKAMVQYTPNFKLHVDYQAYGRMAKTVNSENQLSIVNEDENIILGKQTQNPRAFEQRLSAYYAMGEKNIFSIESTHKLQYQDPFYQLVTSLMPFQNIIPLQSDSMYNLNQSRTIKSENFEALGNYYRILNRINHINLSVGINSQHQKYNAELFQSLENNQTNFDSSAFNNEVDFRFKDYFVGLTYRNKWEKLTWSPQLNLHYYQVEHRQPEVNGGFTRWMLLPGFNAKYDFNRSQSLRFDYSINANFMDVQKVASNLVVNSYNNVSQGNPELMNSWFHSLDLSYRNFNMYSFLNFFGGINYQRKFDDIQNGFTINQWERISTPLNVQFANEQLSGYFNLEKRFQKFRAELNANLSYSKINNQLGDLNNTNIYVRQQYEAMVGTRLWEKVSLRLSHEFVLSQYEGGLDSRIFINNESSLRVNWEVVDGFNWITTYSYNDYSNRAANSSSIYDLMDITLRYRKEGSPWEFSLRGMNVLNTTSIRRDNFSENLISTYAYFIQQSYTVFTVMFDL